MHACSLKSEMLYMLYHCTVYLPSFLILYTAMDIPIEGKASICIVCLEKGKYYGCKEHLRWFWIKPSKVRAICILVSPLQKLHIVSPDRVEDGVYSWAEVIILQEILLGWNPRTFDKDCFWREILSPVETFLASLVIKY